MTVHILDNIQSKKENTHLEQFAIDVLKGFSAKQKYLPSKYFYDDEGSRLFTKITSQDEYYPTRCEAEVFEKNKNKITNILSDAPFNLIELGAGDGQKTKILLEEFTKQGLNFEYIAIDISEAAVQNLNSTLEKDFPNLNHSGIVGEYLDALDWINLNKKARNVVLFLGSTIGNFDESGALVFLRVLWKHLNEDDLTLIGFDLKKDIDTLLYAYNDKRGITKAFNLNLLERMNKELKANFDLDNFMHFGTYNPLIGAMESYLISKKKQVVDIKALEKSFHFKAFEPIHLEYSNKYLIEDIEFLSKEAGFEVVETYFDSKKYFSDSLWKVKKKTF